MPNFIFCVFVFSTLPRRSTTFFGSRSNWAHFRGFWGNNSSKKQTELKSLPQVVLIVAQMLKACWKVRLFTETGDVPKDSAFDLTLTPIFYLKMAEIKNNHLAIQICQNQTPISFQLSVKTIITFCSICFFFRVQMGNGPRVKDQEVAD